MENKLCYCTNIPGLFSVSGIVKLYHSIYQQKDWGSRGTFISKEYNVKEMILVDKVKVLLPPLHIKLGLRKNLVWLWTKMVLLFQHLSTVFPGLSAVKLKKSIFVESQIREVLKDTDFEELRKWEALKSASCSFCNS